MTVSEILTKIMEIYSFNTKIAFAKHLGIKPQVLNNWFVREAMDVKLVYEKCNKLNAHWLLTGKGSEIMQDASKIDQPAFYPDNKSNLTLKRLKEYLDMKGISVRSFEISVGFSNGSFASQLKNNKTIGVDKLEKILRVYSELNANWLLSGTGEMLSITWQQSQNGQSLNYIENSLNSFIETQKELISMQREKISELQTRLNDQIIN